MIGAGFKYRGNVVALEHGEEPVKMIGVRVRQYEEINRAIPERHDRGQARKHARIRTAIDEHLVAVPGLDKKRIPLADIQYVEQ